MIKKIMTLIDGSLRAYPVLIIFYSMMSGLLNNDYKNILFGIILLVSDLFNNILKNYIFWPLMKGRGEIAILGKCARPANSKDSGLFKDGEISNSHGMPSGHAQIAWLFTTYWVLKILNERNRSKITKIVSIIVLCILSSAVAYSRVFFARCHTIQQVFIGSLIGIILGFIVYNTIDNIFFFLENTSKKVLLSQKNSKKNTKRH